jgi:hypothetical protein
MDSQNNIPGIVFLIEEQLEFRLVEARLELTDFGADFLVQGGIILLNSEVDKLGHLLDLLFKVRPPLDQLVQISEFPHGSLSGQAVVPESLLCSSLLQLLNPALLVRNVKDAPIRKIVEIAGYPEFPFLAALFLPPDLLV